MAATTEDRLRRRGQLYIALAAVAWSSAGLLQRELTVDTTTQLAGRAFFAMLALAGFVLLTSRGHPVLAFRSMDRAGLAVAVCIAVASGSFIVALNHASVANVLVMQAAAPIAAALIAWLALGDPITRRSWLAMAIAVAGVGLMVGGPDSGGVIGVGVSIVMTLAFAIGLVITRHRRDVSMAPATCLAQVLVLLVAVPFADPASVTQHDLVVFAVFGVFQIGLGLALLTVGARLIPAHEVAIISLLEVVLGAFWVWIAFSETPGAATLVGGAVVVFAVLLQTTEKTRARAIRPAAAAPDAAR
jgi:drug/metabolite transporter (DMT)-like permease